MGFVSSATHPDESAPGSVVEHLDADTEIIVPLANGEPTAVMDAIEDAVEADPNGCLLYTSDAADDFAVVYVAGVGGSL